MAQRSHPLGDAVVAALLLVGAVVYMRLAATEAAGGQRRDLLGPAGFPRGLALVVILCASVVLLRALWRWRTEARPQREPSAADWQPWAVWALAVAFALTLRPVGFLVVTPLFVFTSLMVVGFRRRLAAGAVAAGATATLYLVFSWFLNVRLPTGFLLDRLLGGS